LAITASALQVGRTSKTFGRLDAVADDAEFRRLFQHAYGQALAPERKRDRGTAESTTGYKNWIVLRSQSPLRESAINVSRLRVKVNPPLSPRAA
jgi:hypothetical protein